MPDADGTATTEAEIEQDAHVEADAVLLAAVDVARAALLETTPASTVGGVIGHRAHDEHVLSLHFATTQPGYPGWHWTVTLSRLDAEALPNVLEVELLPGDGALLAPDWTPWSVRLADYEAAQHPEDDDEEDFDDDLDEEDDEDDEESDAEPDEDGFDEQVILHDNDDDDGDQNDDDDDDDDAVINASRDDDRY